MRVMRKRMMEKDGEVQGLFKRANFLLDENENAQFRYENLDDDSWCLVL